MNLKISCDICNFPLTEQGALYFSPPMRGLCRKLHICVDCDVEIGDFITKLHLKKAEAQSAKES